MEDFLEELLQEIDHGGIRISCKKKKKIGVKKNRARRQTDRQTVKSFVGKAGDGRGSRNGGK